MFSMNKNITFVVLCVLAVVAIFFGYKYSKGPFEGLGGAEASIASVPVADATDFYTISAAYPQDPWDTKGEMAAYVTYVVDQKKEEWKTGGEAYNAEQDLEKQFPDRPKMKYELDISYATSTSERFGTRSYVFKAYEFTGGAHGNTAVTTFTFNEKGKVDIADVLDFANNGNDIALTRILEEKLETILGGNSDPETIMQGTGLAYLRADGTFDNAKCNCDGFFFPSNFQNFTVTDDGLDFIMGQYQVAPYVVGMPEAPFTWDDLRPYLLPDNPLGVK
jgi:hypothetical protein